MAVAAQEQTTSFGQFTITESRPAHLAGVVDGIWHFRGQMNYTHERILPNGCMEIVVQLDRQYRVITDSGSMLCPIVNVAGLQTRPFIVEAPPGVSSVIGLRLRPEGAFAVLQTPMCELTSAADDLEDVVGAAARELADWCHAAPDGPSCIAAAVRWIEARLAVGLRLDPAVAWMLDRLERTGGGVPIAQLREQTGLSTRRMLEAFRTTVGVTPKTYARLMRFRRLLHLLHHGPAPLLEAALESGYYDQAHMNNDFRELSGFTPSEFLGASRYSESSLIDES